MSVLSRILYLSPSLSDLLPYTRSLQLDLLLSDRSLGPYEELSHLLQLSGYLRESCLDHPLVSCHVTDNINSSRNPFIYIFARAAKDDRLRATHKLPYILSDYSQNSHCFKGSFAENDQHKTRESSHATIKSCRVPRHLLLVLSELQPTCYKREFSIHFFRNPPPPLGGFAF